MAPSGTFVLGDQPAHLLLRLARLMDGILPTTIADLHKAWR